MRRSMLFLPGNAPNMIVNGGTLRADAVILDLEDSVAPAEKDAARILVRNALKTVDFGCETVVRINSLDSGFCVRTCGRLFPALRERLCRRKPPAGRICSALTRP